MKVKVIKASLPTYWYADKIGEVFEVEEYRINGGYFLVGEPWFWLNKDDVIVMDKEIVEFT